MKFDLTEDQALMQKLVREFSEKQLAPGVAQRDENEEFSRELFNSMGEMGFTGICFPEEYGGVGGDVLTYILAVEEISRVDDGLGVSLSASVS
ncbi:alkylation response protein AidB-like acyl-CoA dehydrogenase, partial [Sporomusaceae bacterium BoRhaA]|uniref:acyl-CoA dehydrogenase family protein n=1 Tax=Pelorhabdus rhamnosifermentans TaxID=2772457 RepID=UPI001C0618E5